MASADIPSRRRQTLGEELANCFSHGVGLLLALAAVPVLVVSAARHGSAAVTVGASVFAATMVILYLASTVYHALPHGRAKRAARVVDHAAIFLLIAGTYTPFTLGVLRGAWGWTLFGLIWGVCAAGVVLKVVGGVRRPRTSLVLYLTAGWLVIIALKPMLALVPAAGIAWLVAGGLAYTAGVSFYVAHHVRYAHLAWHLSVMGGTACHFVAVLGYAA